MEQQNIENTSIWPNFTAWAFSEEFYWNKKDLCSFRHLYSWSYILYPVFVCLFVFVSQQPRQSSFICWKKCRSNHYNYSFPNLWPCQRLYKTVQNCRYSCREDHRNEFYTKRAEQYIRFSLNRKNHRSRDCLFCHFKVNITCIMYIPTPTR